MTSGQPFLMILIKFQLLFILVQNLLEKRNVRRIHHEFKLAQTHL